MGRDKRRRCVMLRNDVLLAELKDAIAFHGLKRREPVLPILPESFGRYVLRGIFGRVFVSVSAGRFTQRQVEAQAILLSLHREISLEYWNRGVTRYLGVWRNGKMVKGSDRNDR
ncbi:MAG: hypothetical protein ACRC62_15485 [Microcoleus sp.]